GRAGAEALDGDDGATHSPLVVLEWGFWMPLTRGRIGGHDNERLAFAFTMMNDDETVQCQISDAAMDELAEVKGTPSIARQAQFVTHRDTIEKIASELFDKAPIMKGYVVRIFSKHIQGKEPAIIVREPDATMQPTLQDNQLLSKHRVLSFKPQLRLERRGQDGQNKTEQPDHSASLGDSITSSTQIRFSVHTGAHFNPTEEISARVRSYQATRHRRGRHGDYHHGSSPAPSARLAPGFQEL